MTSDLLVSVLLPTRGRVDHLNKSLLSLETLCVKHSDVELLVRVDEDDAETIEYFQMLNSKFGGQLIGEPRGKGYADLHNMVNDLCSLARGRFLFLWNDDATMLTQGWDREIAKHDAGKLCFIDSAVSDSRGNGRFFFPIVHRSYYDTLGHFSMSAHNDTYVYTVLQQFPQVFRTSNIVVQHNAVELIAAGDRTALEAKMRWPETKGEWGKPELLKMIVDDTEKIRKLIEQQTTNELR